jgi:hypothetical protein
LEFDDYRASRVANARRASMEDDETRVTRVTRDRRGRRRVGRGDE